MSLNALFALCILGIDFMIYAFFQWVYGDKRREIARELEARRQQHGKQPPQPLVFAPRGPGSLGRKPSSAASHLAEPGVPSRPLSRESYSERLAYRRIASNLAHSRS